MAKSKIPDPAERPTLKAEEAFALLGLGKWAGYELIRQGGFPVPVLRLGYKIKIPTAPLLELLGLRPTTSASHSDPDPPRPAAA